MFFLSNLNIGISIGTAEFRIIGSPPELIYSSAETTYSRFKFYNLSTVGTLPKFTWPLLKISDQEKNNASGSE